MLKQKHVHWLGLLVVTGFITGCGGGDEDRSRGNVVITPPAAETPVEDAPVADAPAAKTPAAKPAKPAGDAVAATPSTDAPAAEKPKPEMKEEAPAKEVAAAKPAESADAKPEPAAAEKSDAEKGTTFKGRVVVKGDPPPSNPIKPSGNDPYCIDIGEIPNDEVIVGNDGGLADVFVWVRKVPADVEEPAVPEEPAVLDQKNCRFIPAALIVQVGQELLVKNDDATLHNTRISGLTINFNQTVAPNTRDGVPVDINRPESVPVPVKCDIHGWMSARILATDNPWNDITDLDGTFEINNLPSDVELEFRLQHGKAGYVEKSLKLTLKDGEVKEQSFEVDASKLR